MAGRRNLTDYAKGRDSYSLAYRAEDMLDRHLVDLGEDDYGMAAYYTASGGCGLTLYAVHANVERVVKILEWGEVQKRLDSGTLVAYVETELAIHKLTTNA